MPAEQHPLSFNSNPDFQELRLAADGRIIPGLDALRAVAIMLVVLFHMEYPVPGGLGVLIFFVLSGFLITTLLLKEFEVDGDISFKRFYRNRAYRIFPAYYVAWALSIIYMFAKHDVVLWKRAVASFFYLTDYGRALIPLADQGSSYPMGHGWSLAVEEQFYLLWPLLLLFILKRRKPFVWMSGIVIGLWAWRTLLMTAFHVPMSYVYNAFDTRADELFVGCWLALAVRNRHALPALDFLVRRKVTAIVTLGGLATFAFIETSGTLKGASISLLLIAETVLAGAVMMQWVRWGASSWSFLEHPAIKHLARLSYGIYLFHPMMMSLVGWKRHILGALAIFAAATASYYLIEKPALALRNRSTKKQGAAHQSTGVMPDAAPDRT